MSRWWSRLAAALGSVGLVGSLLLAGASSVSAANTRVIYFGSAPAGGLTGTLADLNACDPTTGYCPLTFTPVTSGGATAVDVTVENLGTQTVNHVNVFGGVQAESSFNSSFPPPAGHSLPGAPGQSSFLAGYPASSCTLSTLAYPDGSGTFPNDSISCPVGQLAAGASATFRIVIQVPPTGTYSAWLEVDLNEGTSTTGSNQDTFYATGSLSVAVPSCADVSTFFLGGQNWSLSNSDQTDCQGQTTGVSASAFTNGVPVTVGTSSSTVNSLGDCPLGATGCFGYESTASVAFGSTMETGDLTWTIFWSSSVVPSGGPKGVFKGAFHTHTTSSGTVTDQLYFKKQYQCGSPTANPNFCWVSLSKDKSGNYTAQLVSPTNGKVYGF